MYKNKSGEQSGTDLENHSIKLCLQTTEFVEMKLLKKKGK